MDPKRLGEVITFLRKKQSLTQKELAEGICTQAAISQIEAGSTFPRIDTLFYISVKLRVDIEYFLSVSLYEQNEYISETIKYMEELLNKKNYDDLYLFTSSQLAKGSNKCKLNIFFEQYCLWNHYLSAYYCKKINYLECIDEFRKLISEDSFLKQHNFQDIKIMNSIANIYAENDDFQKSLDIHKQILAEKISLEPFKIFKLKILYNMSKTLYTLDQIESALESILKAINLSKKIENMSLLGQLYYQQGLCLEKLEEPYSEIKKCYKNSYFILKQLNKDFYIEELIKEKGEYLNCLD